jgi:hypothetical protein
VSGDFRVNDLVWQTISHFEIKLLQTPMNTVCWIGFSIWSESSVLVTNKAAVLLDFKPDRTFGRIDAWGLRETLSKH